MIKIQLRDGTQYSSTGVVDFLQPMHPITSIPKDNVRYSEWPYGEKVICNGSQGRITDIYCLERGCMLHDVTVGSDIKQFVYPCDYIDGNISFLEENNQRIFQSNIRYYRKLEERLKNAYKIMNAWKRGFISLCKANLIKIEVVYYIIKEQNSYLCDIIPDFRRFSQNIVL